MFDLINGFVVKCFDFNSIFIVFIEVFDIPIDF